MPSFWSDLIDYRAADDLLRARAPILLVQGGRDGSAPAEAARASADLFARAGRCNLAYWELPGLDHGMVDADGGSRMGEVLALARDWLARSRAGNAPRPCMQAGAAGGAE
ncbi:hypothetical protein SAMN04488021_1646 [Paracoccus aminovorans]|uniref:Prolyl oligopeptidase family protein n=1 Tax=Paracoccus aminovorans TaxID=34004 RepID=A0A1I3F8A4_9RHOB|nr:hypothetical protein [Paracoccus aminovorans]CQR87341.1 hypothetical protein JCM7685_2798 [Paracoccus aminovorans]SFI07418.1 hypothetical protein SAMN04488021_1646 [Paracoccus aminovorans]